jgi:hypothetical protein
LSPRDAPGDKKETQPVYDLASIKEVQSTIQRQSTDAPPTAPPPVDIPYRLGVGLNNSRHCGDNSFHRVSVKFSNFCNEKALMGGEELCRTRKASDSEAANNEICVAQLECPRIPIGLTGYLAEHPVIAIGASKNEGRSQLGLR